MTVEDFLIAAYNQVPSSEYSIYVPGTTTFDLTQAGSQYLLGLLNRAYQRIAAWKFPDGTLLRFRQFNKRKVVQLSGIAITVSGYAETTVSNFTRATIVLSAPTFAVDDKYTRWILNIANTTRLVIAYDGATHTATLDRKLPTAPVDGTAATLYKKWFVYSTATANVHTGENIPLDPAAGIVSMQEVWDITDMILLRRATRDDFLYEYENVQTIPGEWAENDEGIEFRFSPIDGTVYDFHYYAYPEALAAATDEPVINQQWHEAILLWMVQWLHKEERDFDKSYAVRKDMESLIATTKQPFEMSLDIALGKVIIAE